MVAHLLDVDGLTDETRAHILARAEGNPFFLEEILRQLIDEGRIVRENRRWQATDQLPQFELPDTVQGVLAARIDLLRPREKRTLQQASVVGRIFWRGAVAALLDAEDDVDPHLRRLEERELVAARLSSSMMGGLLTAEARPSSSLRRSSSSLRTLASTPRRQKRKRMGALYDADAPRLTGPR